MAEPTFAEIDAMARQVAGTIRAIGRTGAKKFELGTNHDNPTLSTDGWWASAHYRGARISCDNQSSPTGAVFGLYAMVAAGGRCTNCHNMVALVHPDGVVIRARMHEGQFQIQLAGPKDGPLCIRGQIDWEWSGCDAE